MECAVYLSISAPTTTSSSPGPSSTSSPPSARACRGPPAATGGTPRPAAASTPPTALRREASCPARASASSSPRYRPAAVPEYRSGEQRESQTGQKQGVAQPNCSSCAGDGGRVAESDRTDQREQDAVRRVLPVSNNTKTLDKSFIFFQYLLKPVIVMLAATSCWTSPAVSTTWARSAGSSPFASSSPGPLSTLLCGMGSSHSARFEHAH